MLIISKPLTVILVVPVAAVVGVDICNGIMATTMVVIIPGVVFCC